MIKVGDRIPSAAITQVNDSGQDMVTSDQFFAGKKVVLFSVPGAFTPTCSEAHLPGFVVMADQILAKGVDEIACLAVNDAFVMKAWREAQNAEAITMIADGGAGFTQALGLEMKTGDFGGIRSQRFAMIVEDGIVTLLNVEPPKSFEVSKAEVILAAL
ncbi:MAG: peroxiredoxin [Motiliproteus sp.]|nr:peroxiredoxin [Motiliproteus sp.]MCW9053267.1 peroxiredoxin [Motiliproteus sp.]